MGKQKDEYTYIFSGVKICFLKVLAAPCAISPLETMTVNWNLDCNYDVDEPMSMSSIK